MGDPHSHYSGLFRTVSQTTTATTKTTSSTSSSRTIRPFASTTGFHHPSGSNHFTGADQYGQLAQNHPYHAGMGFAPIPPARSSSLNLSSARFMPYQTQMAESSAMGSMSQGQGMMGPPQFPDQHQNQQQQHHQQQQQHQQQMWNSQMEGYPYMMQGIYQMNPQDQALASSSSLSLASQDQTGDEDEEDEDIRPVKTKPKPRKRGSQADAEGEDSALAEERKLRTREKGRERQRRKRERDRMARDGVKPDMNTDIGDVTGGNSTQSSAIEPHSLDSIAFDPSIVQSSTLAFQSVPPKTSDIELPSYSPGLSYSSASVSEHSSPGAAFSRSLPLDGSLGEITAMDLTSQNHSQLKWIPEDHHIQNQPRNGPAAGSSLVLGPIPGDRAPKRTKRRQSEPQSTDIRSSFSKSNAPRPMTASTLSARPTSRRGVSEGSAAKLTSSQAAVDSTTATLSQQPTLAPLSQESSFFASTMIFGVTNSNLVKSLEQNLGIGRNELEEMRGALANVFEQYQVQRGLRNVSIQDTTNGTNSQNEGNRGGETPYSTSSSVFSTPASGSRMNLPHLVINGSNVVQDGPISASSSTSSMGQPFSLDIGLDSRVPASPARSLSMSSQSSTWDPFVQAMANQHDSRGSISQSASPVRPARAPGRNAMSPTFLQSSQPSDLGLHLPMDMQGSGHLGGPPYAWPLAQGLASPFVQTADLGETTLGADHGPAQASEGNPGIQIRMGNVPWQSQPSGAGQGNFQI